MDRKAARENIEKAHHAYELIKSSQSSSPDNAGVVEILHQLIHAVDSIEKRVSDLDGPLFPQLSEKVTPLMKRQTERVRGVSGRAWGAISKRLPQFRREQPAGATLAIGQEVTELKDEVRSLRAAMEALVEEILSLLPRFADRETHQRRRQLPQFSNIGSDQTALP